MKEREDQATCDEHIRAVLTALGSACPEDGFEQRLAHRLAQVPVQDVRPLSWSWAQLRMPLAFAGGGAMLLVALAMLPLPHRRGHGIPALHKQANAAEPSAGDTAAQPRAAGPENAPAVARAAQPRRREQRDSAVVLTAQQESSVGSPSHEASFPAPPMPLTEQERLLLRIAHRNDPEEIAMLDPVERGVRLARERAESAEFFAPEPLPAELQQEIKAALRSQYVNTPPPRDLIAQPADRSTP